MAKDGPLDLSLAVMGALNYSLYVFLPMWPGGAARVATLVLALAIASSCFSIYLLYVLKFLLKDFCVVCSTFHLINFAMLTFAAVPLYKRTTAHQKVDSKCT